MEDKKRNHLTLEMEYFKVPKKGQKTTEEYLWPLFGR